jgi:hypothetical protein
LTWIDRVENTIFTIRTGDGREYTPMLPIGYETQKDFHTAQFDYINLPGAEIARKKVGPRNFPLVFIFTGEDNIDIADAFDTSANDNRAWVIRHPVYGDITGQPINIRRNTTLNATQFNVDFWETIITKGPVATLSPQETVDGLFKEYTAISSIEYEARVELKPADLGLIKNNAELINETVKKRLDEIDYAAYQQQSMQMFTDIDNILNDPIAAIQSIHQVIMAPSRFAIGIDTRINLIIDIYNAIDLMLTKNPTVNNKAYFETAAGVAVLSFANTLLIPFASDYITRDAVITASNNLAGIYNNYQNVLNNAYIPISNVGTAYSPGPQTQATLQTIVLTVLRALQTIAFNAKVERIIMLERDTQLIPLVHKYMGLDNLDANIEIFRTINNIKNKSLFIIQKGTEITYFA